MSESAVLVVSKDLDFAETIVEQVKLELGLTCSMAGDFAQAGAQVVVTTEEVPAGVAGPVLLVRKKPVRLLNLLMEIQSARQGQNEDIVLGAGYVLKMRSKQLQRGAVSVDLTDKEIAIIQCLYAAGVEGEGREQLLKKVWGFDSSLDTHTLETHIYRLRNKLRECLREGEADTLISATPGGYALSVK